MDKIRIMSIDSSLANTGVAIGYYFNGEIEITSIDLTETVKDKSKMIRASSDTIIRCRQTYNFVMNIYNEFQPQIVFAETPSGSQNSSAMKSYGATCQLIATFPIPPIEVNPREVKLLSVGNDKATKKEMIEWASKLYPNLKWDRNKNGSLKNKNEHMADAIAIAISGIQTPQFKQLISLMQ